MLGRIHGAEERCHAQLDRRRNPRRRRLGRFQKRFTLSRVEAVDERLGAERRLDGRQRREVRRLQRVEDEMIEIPFADAPDIGLMDALHVRRKGRRRDALGLELDMKRRRVRPGDALGWRTRLRADDRRRRHREKQATEA